MNQCILVAPTKTKHVLQCGSKNKVLIVTGTHLITVPEGCRFTFGDISVAQDEENSQDSFLIIFNMNMDAPSSLKVSESSVALKQLKLDDPKELLHANFL